MTYFLKWFIAFPYLADIAAMMVHSASTRFNATRRRMLLSTLAAAGHDEAVQWAASLGYSTKYTMKNTTAITRPRVSIACQPAGACDRPKLVSMIMPLTRISTTAAALYARKRRKVATQSGRRSGGFKSAPAAGRKQK